MIIRVLIYIMFGLSLLKIVVNAILLGYNKYPRKMERSAADDLIALLFNIAVSGFLAWALFR